MTTTSSYFVTTAGPLTVTFDSVQLITISPQAYQFNVFATASTGASITALYWDFGDGNTHTSVYCCQSHVSEVQYHQYVQQGAYTVHVMAVDSANQFGEATVTVNWPTPVPEYPSLAIPLLGALLAALATLKYAKTKRNGASMFL